MSRDFTKTHAVLMLSLSNSSLPFGNHDIVLYVNAVLATFRVLIIDYMSSTKQRWQSFNIQVYWNMKK